MNPSRILIVEDELVVSLEIAKKLQALGYEIAGRAITGKEALAMADEQRPSLALMDIRLGGEMDGIETAREIRNRFNTPIIFLTAYSEDETLERAKLAEPYGYILKPFDERHLKSAIDIALSKHQLEVAVESRHRLLEEVFESVPTVMMLLDQDRRVRKINRKGAALSGRKREEIEGLLYGEALNCVSSFDPSECGRNPDCMGCQIHSIVNQTLETGTGVPDAECAMTLRSGSRDVAIHMHVSTALLHDKESKRVIVVITDVTRLKNAESFLRIERDLALKLGSTVDLNKAMNSLLEECLHLPGLDSGGIYIVDQETQQVKLVCHQGLSDNFVESVCLFEPEDLPLQFLRLGQPGYWSAPLNLFGKGELLEREGFQSLAIIPVNHEGAAVGALNLASHVLPEIPMHLREFLEVTAAHAGSLVARLRLFEMNRAQAERLKEANAALKVILKQRDEDRTEIQESLLANVRHLVLPYVEKLKKSRLTQDQKLYLEIIESHLKEITSLFVHRASARFVGLTPAEIRVADLIRQGKSSKEIAELLGASETTIMAHRRSIRGKLDLKQKKVNLQAYLSSLTN